MQLQRRESLTHVPALVGHRGTEGLFQEQACSRGDIGYVSFRVVTRGIGEVHS